MWSRVGLVFLFSDYPVQRLRCFSITVASTDPHLAEEDARLQDASKPSRLWEIPELPWCYTKLWGICHEFGLEF